MMPTKSRPMATPKARMAPKAALAQRAPDMAPMRKAAPMATAARAPDMVRKMPAYSKGGPVKGKSK